MSQPPTPPNPWPAVPLLALAGGVDGIGWLRLDALFVGFMSGSSTLLGLAGAAGALPRAATLAAVIVLFGLGVMAGTVIGLRTGRPAPAVLALVAALLLLAWRLLPAGPTIVLLPLVPAMGLLNTALPGATTFVTGALVRGCRDLVLALAGGPRLAWAPSLAGWAALVAGAAAGGWLDATIGDAALLVPAFAAAIGAVIARFAYSPR